MGPSRLEHLKIFYRVLDGLEKQLGGARKLSEASGRIAWPRRGVYFFMEGGEHRRESGQGLRIVRVGTHALAANSRTELWTRLRQHRGSSRSGGGSHRSSVFRLVVGTALIARDGLTCPTWDTRRASASADIRGGEQEVEQEVSRVIGAMRVLWLPVLEEPGEGNARGYIERNAIALLSNHGKAVLDPPSAGWLGRHCDRRLIRDSGLWNANHVDEAYDPAFLNRLDALAGTEVLS